MTVYELTGILYNETPVEIWLDYDPIFAGTAEDAHVCKYLNRKIDEVYIDIDGTKLIISIDHVRNVTKK